MESLTSSTRLYNTLRQKDFHHTKVKVKGNNKPTQHFWENIIILQIILFVPLTISVMMHQNIKIA